MKRVLKIGAAAMAALLLCRETGRAAPLDDYGYLPTLSHVTLSPSGKMIAYVGGHETKRFVVFQAVGEHQKASLINIGDQKLRDLEWADDTHLLVVTSMTRVPAGLLGHRSEFGTAQWYDVTTNSFHPLLGSFDIDHPWSDAQVMNVIAGPPQLRVIGGHTIVFAPGVYFHDNHGQYVLFRVDLTDSTTRMVSDRAAVHAEDWLVGPAGKIAAETDYDETDRRWKLKLYHDGEPATAVDVRAPIDGPSLEGLSQDGTAVVLSLPETEDKTPYERVSIADGKSSVWQHSGLDLSGVLDGPYTGEVVGGYRITDKTNYVFFDPHTDLMWRSARAAFKSATDVELVSWSEDRTKIIVLVFGPGYGDTYFFVDMTTHKAYPIGPAYDGIDKVAPVKWIDYKAADGRDIHAYLTLPLGMPADSPAKNLPLVVLPHGGPQSRDFPGFDWISQALASRGYVVLQPEFRGSDGFGKDLLWAGFGEFGRKMQTDLSDGVRALAAQGLIDPRRVCIVGGSYGGYAALAGATLDTGVYRCAVSIAGLSDLSALLRYWKWPHNAMDDRSERYWDRFLAVEDADDPKLDAISPIKHVDRVTIPILLIHGRDDTVVPFYQSSEMADALQSAGKTVEFVKLDGEDHWLSRGATRRQMIEATVKFLEANNPPNQTPQAVSSK